MSINVLFEKIRIKRIEKKFNQWPGSVKSRFHFDEWLDLFSNDCNSFNKIALQIGCNRENIRQLYQKYFSRLLPDRPDGRSRQKICTLEKRKKIIKIKTRDFSSRIPTTKYYCFPLP